MELEKRLREYLKKIKEEFNLSSDLSSKSVLKILKDELNFRERLLISVKEKLELISKTFNVDIKNQLEIKDLDEFKISFFIDSPLTIDKIKSLSDLNLHFLFFVEIFPYITLTQESFHVFITLNENKLAKIKKYM